MLTIGEVKSKFSKTHLKISGFCLRHLSSCTLCNCGDDGTICACVLLSCVLPLLSVPCISA